MRFSHVKVSRVSLAIHQRIVLTLQVSVSSGTKPSRVYTGDEELKGDT